jgi:pyruvate/2-oxoglutarate dehydrogenase complex dihydrolipoamide acyltransferase (E2) component
MKTKGYSTVPFSFNRLAVRASAIVNKKKNTFHSITETDITSVRQFIRDHFAETGEKLSLTAWVVFCLARTLREFPEMNSFRKGRKLIILNDITVNVLVERKYQGELVPEPAGIRDAGNKSWREISRLIREAKQQQGAKLGSLSGMTWVRLIPGFLFIAFIRLADKNIRMGIRYGKVAVTAVGMFSREPVWFVPHGSATILVTVGGIADKVVPAGDGFESREHLCLTVSFDHDIIDGAPAARFLRSFTERVRSAPPHPPA